MDNITKMITYKTKKNLILSENQQNDYIEIITTTEENLTHDILLFLQKLANKLNDKDNIYFSHVLINNIRWTSEEIINGFIELTKDKVIKLKNAININKPISIVVYVYSGFLFRRFSNIFKFIHEEKTEKVTKKIINDILTKEMEELRANNNSYKYYKKMFKLALLNDDEEIISKLSNLFTENINTIYKYNENINNIANVLGDGYNTVEVIANAKESMSFIYKKMLELLPNMDEQIKQEFQNLPSEPNNLKLKVEYIYSYIRRVINNMIHEII